MTLHPTSLPPLTPEFLSALRDFTGETVDHAVILGSGLGGLVDRMECERCIPTTDLPGYPRSTVPGHVGALHLCRLNDTRVLFFQGRIHGYEGYAIEEVILPVRIACALGARRLLVTNAAGGLHPAFSAGDLMLISDILALPVSPVGRFEQFFATTGSLLSTDLLDTARAVSAQTGVLLREGVYGYCSGPSYETPAEIGFFRMAGIDAMGMSTLPELLAARQCGLEALGISCITNKAVTVRQKVSHDEVTAMAALVADRFSSLVLGILSRW
ncbi:MAG: purine-nucleoside phosphorylase [Bacteroidetes bacterium]|nr:purine-nucleoside phosphorylase [Bacteroidota bacterium]